MDHISKPVAWICLFSTLLTGCYTSNLIDPIGDQQERLHSGTIRIIVTNDGKKHEFDSPPSFADSTFTGAVEGKPVTIPLSDVSKLYAENLDVFRTTAFSVLVAYTTFGFIYWAAEGGGSLGFGY